MNKTEKIKKGYSLLYTLPYLLLLTGCVPKIQLETPKDGITINMNVDVKHQIDIKMDKQTAEILNESK